MSITNLNTLKAKVRQIVDSCALYSQEELPPVLRVVAENKQDAFILTENMIHDLAAMMQKHEEWANEKAWRTYSPIGRGIPQAKLPKGAQETQGNAQAQ